jgi:glyoxylase-like metal-dependent hydrolase (beta-lactamase superfamily II)
VTREQPGIVEELPGLARVADSCNVWVLKAGREAALVDVGSGAVFDLLPQLGVDRVTDVLLTHHHRDTVQGLARAVEHGARVWAPWLERGLLDRVDEHWRTRQLGDDYDLREDRFSLLESVPVTGSVAEHRTRRYGAFDIHTLPTPGHTTGSMTYLVELDGRRLAFTGDLLFGPGKVWSLAATQWSYSGMEGQAATAASCLRLAEREPDLLLPAHGAPISEPRAALELTAARMQELVELRRLEPWDAAAWVRETWEPLSPHLLRSRRTFANSYALLSETGAALIFDWGYDGVTGILSSTDRRAFPRLLLSLDALRRDHGVDRIEAVAITHYHDDHVAGVNLLRDVEGTEAWIPENVAPILADPQRYDLPCLWYEPVPADRTLRLGEPVRWHEHELTVHPLPGHTLYAAAYAFEVDGRRVLVCGDQQALDQARPDGPDVLNYQYRNRFRIDDYAASAALYRELGTELLLGGHWLPKEVTPAWLDRMEADGRRLAELHRELLPLDEVDLGATGFAARLEPYRAEGRAGQELRFEATVRNPFAHPADARVAAVVPAGWRAGEVSTVSLAPHEERRVELRVVTGSEPVVRARLAVDVTVDGVRFGQQAEALVDVVAG